jgi:RNA polymerase II subunit A small phosphatase-like protein
MSSVYVVKRPFCEEFIYRANEWFEIVLFTASISDYAMPLYAKLDRHRVTASHLFRDHCTFLTDGGGLYVKDLSRLGRPLSDVILLDNSPLSALFQPENALPCSSWYGDKQDRELLQVLPIL